ncbi:leucine-rich repeat LGI family member 2-like isoform X2 [Acipenser ruthenus]|uniref:leucine-rich repeat LGI family member 2-like isoform X2 n=1 Tax=Acipenser ruthenus TaxID=7906 RepID=UPI00145C0BD0|nr:leucine-rich repeat LGI family member 2-like isoform X2 [Acipenser ruthenus]
MVQRVRDCCSCIFVTTYTAVSGGKMQSLIKGFLLFPVLFLVLFSRVHPKRIFRCPSACTCTKESIICVGSSSVPRIIPNDINSLLLNSNAFSTIKDDAFSGLLHLEYLFIENNKIETTSKHSFRGLWDLTHLSLANNNIKYLPREVFSDLDSLIELDLRGNSIECDCKSKWLLTWLKTTNSTVSDVYCAGPAELKGRKLNDLQYLNHKCTSTDFVLHQTLPFQSLSVDTFDYKNDVYVAIAQPNMENCMVLEWDHIEMNFRSYDNITGQSIVGCKAILIEDQIFIIVAQLFGGSHIYKYDESQTKFTKFQDIEVSKISKPNDIEAFQIDKEWFFVIADSSKAGLSTLYKWNTKGFYSYQSLHEWFRDTDSEFVDLDGKPHLILASRSQVPVIFQWNKSSKKFTQQSEIPNMEDVVAVKSFQMKNELYLALTRFIGDSKVLKWTNKQFVDIQSVPSRGSMIMQPFSFKERHYLALGSDYTFSQIYIWDEEKKLFIKFKEIYIQAPRSFTAVSTDRRDFIFTSSFKGNTQIFEHTIVDLSL